MKSEWYYSQAGQQLGPVSAQQLKQMAVQCQLLPSDLVWKEGMADWTPAQELKGLFKKPAGQAKSNSSDGGATSKGNIHHEKYIAKIRNVVLAHRHLRKLFLLMIVFFILWFTLSPHRTLINSTYFLIVFPYQLFCAFRLARALELSKPNIAAAVILLLIPISILKFIVLFYLDDLATKFLAEGGVKVGFLGVRSADIPS